MNELVTDGRAEHPFPIWAFEEKCRCGKLAAHKIQETSGPATFHPLTAYLCCEHFAESMGHLAHYAYPYGETE